MSEAEPSSSTPTGRGRGRGKSRGGLGKYLRARGRGRGFGRPAEFHKRLVLEGEAPNDEEEEEAAAELAAKFSRRQLGTNADRYAEPEPELGSDGEPIVEPEVDLSTFLERQRISDDTVPTLAARVDDDEDDVDHSLDHITSKTSRVMVAPSKKGKVEQIEWDKGLDEMSREKAAAEATWELKSRFRAKSEKLRGKPLNLVTRDRKGGTANLYEQAPELPLPDGSQPKPKPAMKEMEEFLDELLN